MSFKHVRLLDRVLPRFRRLPLECILAAGLLSALPTITRAATSTGALAGALTPALPLLTNAVQVRDLSVEEAKRRYPVRLRAVVTYYDQAWSLCFVQDSTSGIFVWFDGAKPELRQGHLIEVEGVSGPGDYAPTVEHARGTILGEGELPTRQNVTSAQLLTGSEDSQWVEIEGVVRSLDPEGPHLKIKVAMVGLTVEMLSPLEAADPFPSNLFGAKVRVCGVSATIFNAKRHLIGIRMYLQKLHQIEVVEAGVSNPFVLPLQSIEAVLQFRPERPSDFGHLTRTRGFITHLKAGERVFFHDGTNGLSMRTRQTNQVQVGDQIEVAGFPERGGYTTLLDDAVMKVIGPGKLPEPRKVSADQIMTDGLDCEYVEVDAYLLNRFVVGKEQILVLQDRYSTFQAFIPDSLEAATEFKSFLKGSRLRLTGVTAIEAGADHQPQSLRLLAQSPRNVTLLETPSRWTPERWRKALLALGGLILLSGLWLVVLRGEVKRQTGLARRRLEQEIAMERRFHELVDHAADMIYSVDLQGNFTSINQAGVKLLGYSQEEIVGHPFTMMMRPDPVGIHGAREAPGGEAQAGAVRESEFIHRDGHAVAVEISSWPLIVNGREIGIQAIARDITQRKRTERDLRQLTRAVEQSPASVLITDLQGRIEYVNKKFVEVTGYSPEEVIGQNPRLLKSGDLPEEVYQELWQTITAGREWHGELRNKKKNGVRFWESAVVSPIKDERGTITHFLAVKEDITEKKCAASVMEENQRLLRAILDNIPDPAWLKDADGRFLACNEALSRFYGRTIENTVGQTVFEIAPNDAQRLAGEDQEILKLRRSARVEEQMSDSEGRTRWFETVKSPIFDSRGRLFGTVGIARDITARREAEKRLRASEERYRQLVELSPDGIIIVCEGRFAFINPAGLRLFGAESIEDVLEKPIIDRVLPEDRELLAGRMAAGNPTGLSTGLQEGRYLRLDGTVVHVEVAAEPFLLDTKPASLIIVHDISERKQLEEQFRQAQKMEAVGRLAGGVAHDFNNILAVIRLNAEFLIQGETTPERQGSLEQLIAGCDHAAKLTRQLLAFGRKQVIQVQPQNLNEVVKNMTKMLDRIIGEDVQLQCIYATGVPLIRADAGMLEQVLVNLVVNARDAMPQGGQLHIGIERINIAEAYVRTHPEARAGAFACLMIKDSGTGIAPENLPHVFEPFFTTKEKGKGTGLGLATVYGIIKQHEGWVEVSSEVGIGTCFKIFLPTIEAPTAAPKEEEIKPMPSGGTETILLVEDDEAVRSVTERVLKAYGYTIHQAASAREAQHVWQSHRDEIQLLVTDLVMPEGITGRDLAEQLRSQRPALPVIFMSGYGADVVGSDPEYFSRTNSQFLQKPCPATTLLQTVRQTLTLSN